MEREKFMQEARRTVHRILEGKENGIMNLVQQAWTEGNRNVSVETLWAAIDEAVDRLESQTTMEDLDRLKDPEYPAWRDWLRDLYGNPNMTMTDILESPIDPEIAQRLDIVPKRVKPKEPPKDVVYPTWLEWLKSMGVIPYMMSMVVGRDDEGNFIHGHVDIKENALKPMPADIAQKLGIEPKEG